MTDHVYAPAMRDTEYARLVEFGGTIETVARATYQLSPTMVHMLVDALPTPGGDVAVENVNGNTLRALQRRGIVRPTAESSPWPGVPGSTWVVWPLTRFGQLVHTLVVREHIAQLTRLVMED